MTPGDFAEDGLYGPFPLGTPAQIDAGVFELFDHCLAHRSRAGSVPLPRPDPSRHGLA